MCVKINEYFVFVVGVKGVVVLAVVDDFFSFHWQLLTEITKMSAIKSLKIYTLGVFNFFLTLIISRSFLYGLV